jgi:chloramphenicol 3-O-phosphotransferase
MATAGFIIEAAFMCLNAAMLSGKGALAMAISQTQSFFWLFLEMVISFRVPYLYECAAMGVGLSGATVNALAKK